MSDRFTTLMRAFADKDGVLHVTQPDARRSFFEIQGEAGRTHVLLALLQTDEQGEDAVMMLAEIGPARETLYEAMLLFNLQLRYARTTLLDHDGQERAFALIYNQPLRDTSEAALGLAFDEIAVMVDAIAQASLPLTHQEPPL